MIVSHCEFSPDRKYRYFLRRELDASLLSSAGGTCLFVMLNPSTADEIKNDPTVERCQRRAESMGFAAVAVVNIFAWRSTDPSVLSKLSDPIGPKNDFWIEKAVREADLVVCAWGTDGNLLNRGKEVLVLIRKTGKTPHALKINSDGTPAHPLYIGYDVKPSPIEGEF